MSNDVRLCSHREFDPECEDCEAENQLRLIRRAKYRSEYLLLGFADIPDGLNLNQMEDDLVKLWADYIGRNPE